MAATKITPVKLTRNAFSNAVAANTAIDATDGAYFEMTDQDQRYLIIAENSDEAAAKTIKIKAGDFFWATDDLEQEIAATAVHYACIDSGRFKNMSGTNKGRVLITGTDAKIKVSVYILP